MTASMRPTYPAVRQHGFMQPCLHAGMRKTGCKSSLMIYTVKACQVWPARSPRDKTGPSRRGRTVGIAFSRYAARLGGSSRRVRRAGRISKPRAHAAHHRRGIENPRERGDLLSLQGHPGVGGLSVIPPLSPAIGARFPSRSMPKIRQKQRSGRRAKIFRLRRGRKKGRATTAALAYSAA